MTRRRRAGFTVVEVIVAMALTLAVFAITLPFVRTQAKALGQSAGRLDAEQLARYAQRAIDADLRRATADPGQPLIVYAGRMGISFTANLVARDTLDLGAAELQSGAAATLTESWRLSDAEALPLAARTFPAQDYLGLDGGVSRNETIHWFLQADTITGRSDIYVLYRQVNGLAPVEIVRNLQVPADSAMFSYHRPVSGVMTRIANNRLPLYWDSTAVDSIRSVGLRVAGYYRDRTTATETIRTVEWTTMLPNAASRLAQGCGAAPGAPDDVAADRMTGSWPARVEIDFDASNDDDGGANDVRQYVIEWRRASTANWQAIATVPADGSNTYRWVHVLPRIPQASYQYGVRAIDCGGNFSVRDTDGALNLPVP